MEDIVQSLSNTQHTSEPEASLGSIDPQMTISVGQPSPSVRTSVCVSMSGRMIGSCNLQYLLRVDKNFSSYFWKGIETSSRSFRDLLPSWRQLSYAVHSCINQLSDRLNFFKNYQYHFRTEGWCWPVRVLCPFIPLFNIRVSHPGPRPRETRDERSSSPFISLHFTSLRLSPFHCIPSCARRGRTIKVNQIMTHTAWSRVDHWWLLTRLDQFVRVHSQA